MRFNFRQRIRAAGIHAGISLLVAAVAAGLVFGLWYPGPFRLLAGGQGLFFLLVTVDVVLGPCLTFAVFDLTHKSLRHLRRDLAAIALCQSIALGFGLHTVFSVRPIGLVFEVDRLRVISAVDVYEAELPLALAEYRQLPLTGPWLLAAREASTGKERNEALFMGLSGIDMGQRPSFWQPYAEARSRIQARARPLAALLARYPARHAEIDSAVAKAGVDPANVTFLPVMGRGDWIALLGEDQHVIDFLPLDGFF